MGGIVSVSGAKIASSLNEIAQQKAAKKSYRSLVQQADKQAKLLQIEEEQEQQT